ncbi:hypothetical protein WJX72_012013 [[Myrmecia] bisecta]|uniref:Formate/nitrite transporter n=1 Tax=[Myrmecia] bisecta TaxID=41462 RepID=A0AAW1PDI3_9CHLO
MFVSIRSTGAPAHLGWAGEAVRVSTSPFVARPERSFVRRAFFRAQAADLTTTTSTNGTTGALPSRVGLPTIAPSPATPAPVPALLLPPAIYQKAAALGQAKTQLPPSKILALGILGGVFIGFGAFLAMTVGGACPGLAATNPGLQKMVLGAFGLPFGLLMVLICGAELFTGNTALVTTAVYERKAGLKGLLKNWFWSYSGNLLGSLLMVALVASTGIFAVAPAKVWGTGVAKTSLTFGQAFTRGILCNWLVCLAIWQASAASTLASKAVAVWFPISAFVAMGLEHSVANMFIIPLCIVLGGPITWSQFFLANLLPVTLGNIVGGAVCVATAFSFSFGRLGQPKAA